MSAKFHFINHACFMLEKNNSAIIFDPYLDDNPEGLTAVSYTHLTLPTKLEV